MKFSIIRYAGKCIKRFSLRGKALLVTGSVLLSLVLIGGIGVDYLLRRSFVNLENYWINENAGRVQQLIDAEREGLRRITHDYAVWTETYDFLSRPDPMYIKSNFNTDVFKNLQLYGVFIYRTNGARNTGFTLKDDESGIENADPGWDVPLGGLSRKVSSGKVQNASGLIKYNGKIFLVSCNQILKDNGVGSPAGCFIHIKMFNRVLLDRISQIAGIKIDFADNAADSDKKDLYCDSSLNYCFSEIGEYSIQLIIPVIDIEKKETITLVTSLDRKIHRESDSARFLFYILLAVIVLVAGFLNQFLFKRLVIFKLEKMLSGVREVSETLDLSKRFELNDNDELDELAGGINRMFDSFEDEKQRCDTAEQEKELMQEYMLQAKKMEALGTMAGGIAHDFNNMLVIILGSAELLRADLPSGHPALDHVEGIEKAGQNASALVRRMLTLNKGYSASKIYFSVGYTINDMLNLIKANLPGYITLNLYSKISDDLIYADIAQFQQVIINLVTNSAHAMAGKSKGNLDIIVSEVYLPVTDYRMETIPLPEGRYLRIEVTDSGNGIPADIQGRIFEPFFSTKPVGSGTGLGLAVVHGFVVNNGGSIGVESDPGRYTRFIIHLPSVKEKRKAVVRAGSESANILIVDDDSLVRKTLVSGLRRLGYTVHDAASGHSALKLLEESPCPIRLVITDEMMPGMSGHELSGRIFSLHPGLPVILISGYISGLDDSNIDTSKFVKILMKPVSLSELDELINEALNLNKKRGIMRTGQTP